MLDYTTHLDVDLDLYRNKAWKS